MCQLGGEPAFIGAGLVMLPENVASPSANTPPSFPTSQYPLPLGVAHMPETGAATGLRAADP